jgi:hypothetical protein
MLQINKKGDKLDGKNKIIVVGTLVQTQHLYLQ